MSFRYALIWVVSLLWAFHANARTLQLYRETQKFIEVSMHVGDSLSIFTELDPLTAYHWEVINFVSGPETPLLFMSRKTEDEHSSSSLGSPERIIFEFKAQLVGHMTLKFNYFAGSHPPGFSKLDDFEVSISIDRSE